MYEFLKTAIVAHTYTDLAAMTAKVHKAWAMSTITDEEHAELLALLRAEQPCYDLDVQGEIAKLWAAVKALQNAASAPQTEPAEEPVPEWQQPTGAHDAYHTGDRVLYNGVTYESLIDGNVWSPEVYPAGWQEVTNDAE